jgi:hypothetical protein
MLYVEPSSRTILFASWERTVSFQPYRILPAFASVQARLQVLLY